MFIAKNNDFIVLAKDTREELEQALQFMVYTSIEETDIDYRLYNGEYLTSNEIAERETERINGLNLTKADFWIALLDRDITKNMVKEKINLIPDEKLKAKTLIRLDDADHFWRGDPSMNVIGAMFDITPQDLNYLFENGELPKE
jgi:hypothetical protein